MPYAFLETLAPLQWLVRPVSVVPLSPTIEVDPTAHEIPRFIIGPIPMASARTLSSAPMRHSSCFRRHTTARCGRARSHVTVPWTRISARPSFPSSKPGGTSIRSSRMVLLRSSKSSGRDRAEKHDRVQLHSRSRKTLYIALFHPLHVLRFSCLLVVLLTFSVAI